MHDDFYEVLQVHHRAEPEVIQAAFRTLARKHHPDFGGNGARMVALNEAWAVLSNRRKRAAYDTRRASQFGTITVSVPRQPAEPRASQARGGTILDFGRHAGRTISELARLDPYYLEWLERTPIGRPFRAEIEEALGRARAAAVATRPAATKQRQGWFRGR